MCEVAHSREKREKEMGRGMERRLSGGRGVAGNASCNCHLFRLLIIHSFSVSATRTGIVNAPEDSRNSSAGSPGQSSSLSNSAHLGSLTVFSLIEASSDQSCV